MRNSDAQRIHLKLCDSLQLAIHEINSRRDTMTIEELQRRTRIQQQYLNGEFIEFRVINTFNWIPCKSAAPMFRWDTTDYRVKPKPLVIHVEKWANVYPSGNVSVYDDPASAHKNLGIGGKVIELSKDVKFNDKAN